MATKYVYHGAAGSNDGSDWDNAWTAFASATGVAAGDEVRIASDHSESPAANQTYTFTNSTGMNPVKIISTNRSTNAYEAGASITISGSYTLALNNSVLMYGVTLTSSGGNATFQSHVYSRFYNCVLGSTGNTTYFPYNTSGFDVACYECTIHKHGSVSYRGYLRFTKCTFVSPAANGYLNLSNSTECTEIIYEDCDLSGEADLISTMGTANAIGMRIIFRRCKLHSSYVVIRSGGFAVQNGFIIIEHCTSGKITVPTLGITHYQSYLGTVTADSSAYRTGGASDGTTNYSWKMITTANALESLRPLMLEKPLVRQVSGGSSITVTVNVASGADLDNDEFWCELHGPDNTAADANNPTSKGYFASTRCAPNTTPTTLARSTGSSWEGTGTGTDGGTGQQKVTFTFTPQIAGPISIYCFLAKPSATVYVDPKLEVT